MKIFLNERINQDGSEWLPSNREELELNALQLLDTLESFNFLTEANVHYSSEEFTLLLENLEIVNNINEYSITNIAHQLRTILFKVDAIDWSFSRSQRSDHIYYYISGLGSQNINISGSSVAEAVENKFSGEKVAMINFTSSSFNELEVMNLLRVDLKPPNTMDKVDLEFITSQKSCVKFYHFNCKPRTYSWNPKHGENGKGMISNKAEIVSPLECSKEEAELLLKYAIGYRKTHELYNYDSAKFKYLVWKCESKEQNIFHGYHPINQNEVATEIKDFIEKVFILE
jgi:hypothetical protein